jgi:hypothetical protein
VFDTPVIELNTQNIPAVSPDVGSVRVTAGIDVIVWAIPLIVLRDGYTKYVVEFVILTMYEPGYTVVP